MSAAEKLRALEEIIRGDPDRFAEAMEPIGDALPQIVAVVAAAEELDAYWSQTSEALKSTSRELAVALAALDEALGDVT